MSPLGLKYWKKTQSNVKILTIEHSSAIKSIPKSPQPIDTMMGRPKVMWKPNSALDLPSSQTS
jgi:hypothetical protein